LPSTNQVEYSAADLMAGRDIEDSNAEADDAEAEAAGLGGGQVPYQLGENPHTKVFTTGFPQHFAHNIPW
jgi:hypothetical protein